ncbi:glutathione S-transferase C-terminal domain-containing protein [Shimia sp. R9_2]|uniref:glutathione S-transferase family protein n=1 Tax=Shimia sp. R9_2 TaxID=2821112 RepID=UPI001ADCA641|nr:glutathione binding-like protein [Shimia sp. R9_2]MBO9396754.1 glutathione S-transferase C-terminal domain-containing protein [Shimia sp. R9_2]
MPALLYHCPFNCSLAVRFAAAEGGVPLDIDLVDFATKALASGGSLLDVNPLGQVSTLRLETGELLTETTACLLWVQSQAQANMRITADNPDYFQLVRWVSFTATELHKQILRVVFYPEATDPVKDNFRALAPDRLALLNTHLSTRDFLVGNRFTAADAYLVWFLVLSARAQVPIAGYPHLEAYFAKQVTRPKIAALITEDEAARAKT